MLRKFIIIKFGKMKNKNNNFKFKKKNQKEKITVENYTKIFNSILSSDKQKIPFTKMPTSKLIEGKFEIQKSKNIIEKKIERIIKINPLKSFRPPKNNNSSYKKQNFTKNNTTRKNIKELKIENYQKVCRNKRNHQQILTGDENTIIIGSDKYNNIKRNSASTKKLHIKKPILEFDKNTEVDDDYLINGNSAKKKFNKSYITKENKENTNRTKLIKNKPKKDFCRNKIIENSEKNQKNDNSGQNNLTSPISKKYFIKKRCIPKNPIISNKNEIIQNRKPLKIDSKNKKLYYNKMKANNSIDMNYLISKKNSSKNKENNKNVLNSNSESNNNIDNLNFPFNTHINNKKLIINNDNNNININININNINDNTSIENCNENKKILGVNYSRSDNKLIQISANNNNRIGTLNLSNYNKEQQKFFYRKQNNINEYERSFNTINQSRHSKKFFYYRNVKNKPVQVESININLCKDSNNDKSSKDNEEYFDDCWSNKSSMNFSVKTGNIISKRFRSLSRERDKYKLLHNKDAQDDFLSVIDKKLSNLVDEIHNENFESSKTNNRFGFKKEIKNQKSNRTSKKSFNSIF